MCGLGRARDRLKTGKDICKTAQDASNEKNGIQADFKQNWTKPNGKERHLSRPNGQQDLLLDGHLALCLYCALCLYSACIINAFLETENRRFCENTHICPSVPYKALEGRIGALRGF